MAEPEPEKEPASKGAETTSAPESARRVIAVLELSEKSSRTHQAETVPYEFD